MRRVSFDGSPPRSYTAKVGPDPWNTAQRFENGVGSSRNDGYLVGPWVSTANAPVIVQRSQSPSHRTAAPYVDAQFLDSHLGHVRNYYEGRIAQLEAELQRRSVAGSMMAMPLNNVSPQRGVASLSGMQYAQPVVAGGYSSTPGRLNASMQPSDAHGFVSETMLGVRSGDYSGVGGGYFASVYAEVLQAHRQVRTAQAGFSPNVLM